MREKEAGGDLCDRVYKSEFELRLVFRNIDIHAVFERKRLRAMQI